MFSFLDVSMGSPPKKAEVPGMYRQLLLLVGLVLATATLSGCIVEAPGHYHWWGWHHDEH
jgi:hypothetical protein